VFKNDELIEKFHSLINEWIHITIDVIQHLVEDTTASNEIITNNSVHKLSFNLLNNVF
jgi:hypothetical protein